MRDSVSPTQQASVFINTVRIEQAKGTFRDGDVVYRLEIFHNPFASVPLSAEFAGPFDDQWMGNRNLGIYYEASWGVRGHVVPGRKPLTWSQG